MPQRVVQVYLDSFWFEECRCDSKRDLHLLMMGLTWEEIFIKFNILIVFEPMFGVFLECLETVFWYQATAILS